QVMTGHHNVSEKERTFTTEVNIEKSASVVKGKYFIARSPGTPPQHERFRLGGIRGADSVR
ncbi:MAG: hypothetical protein WEB62_04250, partial [Bacteroidota bacterium]